MRVVRNAEKVFVGQNNLHCAIFHNDDATVYNMIYRDGRDGAVYAKRFQVTGITRDKVYTLTKGTQNSRVLHFSVHENDEASGAVKLRVHLKPAPRLRVLELDFDFAELAIKGRASQGNIVTKHAVDRVVRAPNTPTAPDPPKEGWLNL